MYIRYSIPDKDQLHYKVCVKTYSEKAKQKENILTYDYTLCLKRESFKGYIVNFRRENVLLNNKKEQEPINEILLITGRLLQDLDLEIGYDGRILKIKNFNEIKQYWQEIRFIIEETYKGEIISRILDPIERNMQEESLMIESFYKDPFFYHYLKCIYGKYNNNYLMNREKLKGLVPSHTLSIAAKNSLKILDDRRIRIISMSQVSQEDTDMLSKALVESGGEGKVDIQLNAIYDLSPEKVIQSIEVTNELYYDHLMEKSVQVSIEQIM